jgi:hypothetical protein
MMSAAVTQRFGYAEDAAGWEALELAYRREVAASDARYSRLVRSGTLGSREAWAAQTHGVVRKLASRFRFSYEEV